MTIDWTSADFLAGLSGLLGGLLLAIPFFKDWSAKRKRQKNLKLLKSGVLDPAVAAALKVAIENRELDRVLSAEVTMALLSWLGAGFLILSFVISLFQKH